jgi:hypothetical protein
MSKATRDLGGAHVKRNLCSVSSPVAWGICFQGNRWADVAPTISRLLVSGEVVRIYGRKQFRAKNIGTELRITL